MARNECTVDAPPAGVFRVLADPHSYAEWVVGAKTIRGVEGAWPEPGATFHHTVGIGPLQLRDTTQVLEAVRDARLVLSVRARPAGVGRVEFTLHPVEGSKTRIVMEEVAVSGPAAMIPKVLLDPLTFMRNAEALRRLKKHIERQRTAVSP